MVLKLELAKESPGVLVKPHIWAPPESDLAGVGWDPKTDILNKLLVVVTLLTWLPHLVNH